MKKFKQFKWLIPILLQFFVASSNAQMNVGELFFDTDPGIGNGIPILVQQVNAGSLYDSTLVAGSVTVPPNMSPGFHTIYVRYANYNNVNGYEWGNYEARKFYVNPPSGNGFAKAEYFFDSDPGIGNATSISLNGNPDSADFSGNIPTTGLLPGVHTLHVRAQSATGFWSNYETRKIIVNVANGSNIVEAEYFYDNDPGIGNATSISISGNTDSSDFAGNVNTTGLSLGVHQLCIRSKTASGNWGNYEIRKIKILSTGNSIEKMEYFYDDDPGVGNGTSLAIIPNGDSSSFTGNIPTTGLASGTHMLYVRGMNIEGTWSQYEKRKVQVLSHPSSAEYFFDTDPGVGNGNLFSLTSSGNGIAEYSGGIISNPNLAYGSHMLYVRSIDDKGHWGNYDSLSIFINCKNPGLPTITQTIGVNQCGEQGVLLSASADSLHDAAYWNWYSGSCGGTLIDTGLSIFVAPTDTTIYYIKGEGGCVVNAPCSNIQVDFDPSGLLNLKLFIQGFYAGSNEMTTALLNQNQATCPNVTDTIVVELHNPINFSLEATQQIILKTDGIARCQFPANLGSHYVVIKHRNSIETWSSLPIVLNNELTEYDFTISNSQSFGDNQIEVESNIWAVYSGDINQDATIDIFDFLEWDFDNQSFHSGYYSSDLNGDGNVDIFDFLIWDPNNQNFIGVITP